MKLIILMGIKADAERLRKTLSEHQVPIFSELEIQGYLNKAADESQNWFARQHPAVYSQLAFTMVDDAKADEVMQALAPFATGPHPLHALQVAVEKFI